MYLYQYLAIYVCICGLPAADGVKGHKIFRINAEDLRS